MKAVISEAKRGKQLKEKGRIRYVVKRVWGTIVWTVQLVGVLDERPVLLRVEFVMKARILDGTRVEVSLLNTRLTPEQKASSYG